jgi:hypothetical protein
VLPEDHPLIGEGRVGSGVACGLIFDDFSDVFVFIPRPILFSIDLFSALACYNVSLSLERAGSLPRALEAAREALRMWQATQPLGHKDISDAEKLVRWLGKGGGRRTGGAAAHRRRVLQ